ncbi:HNH endonuclease [Gordonia phage Suzy]|uniref:HNH endonuclease n=1 Tax=Gordonia phage Suzy TaxID=2201430 RepID=A0A2Z4Q8H4_9CAUD|nr:HNH endonuclease [Gordonia phage Suzy]AWY06155.1 HNH endonuclease [Gordonia phage Suzy]
MASPQRKRKRERFYLECVETEAPCWICGEPIEYLDADGEPILEGPWSFSLDHYETVCAKPELEWNYDNWRASHHLCNQRRGARRPSRSIWIGSKELGRWQYKEPDDKYRRRIAREEQKYRIMTGVISQDELPETIVTQVQEQQLVQKLFNQEMLQQIIRRVHDDE